MAGKGGRLAGKRCFVSAAGQGIGRSIAEAFAAEGAEVVAADLRFADDVLPPGVERLILDVTDDAALADAVRAAGAVSVLVNCVGKVASGTILDAPLDELDDSYRLNVRSTAAVIRAFLPGMIERGDGSIINIASVVSSVMAAPGRFAYASTKAAVIGLTMSVALDFVKSGIRCNAISPGTVETPSLHDRWAATGDIEAARAAFVARQPMGRLGAPDEIAAAAILLASDEARFMTGANMVIDGGMSL
ncbi:SDR family oxidoreductase [Sphingopyxis sp.]|jgi:2-keto-3-deoxy-L-fuconate dehydrogenase|uniref:SDR family oxidoreductase n=1 Tax=Sphingopyxis sp. TaxID=1908224 RepID=UPI002DEA8D0B|nr:SDR family oxidoreductase [Sphingopyxis sp.]